MKDLANLIIEYTALVLEVIGVIYVITGSLIALYRHVPKLRKDDSYQELRKDLGKVILLGLEILVAADIIATVSADATLQSVLILGLIVMIRTFLSFSIELDVEGRIPWKKR